MSTRSNISPHREAITLSKPAWSIRKRIRVGTLASVSIGCISLLIGLGFYGMGRKLGVFQSQSIQTLVLEKLADNPEVLGTINLDGPGSQACRLSADMKLVFSDAWRTTDSGCETLTIQLDNNRTLIVHIALYPQRKDIILRQLDEHLSQVLTQDFSGAYYETTVVAAMRNNLPYHEYSLAISPQATLTVTFAGGDEHTTQTVNALIRSMQVI